jgi:hypothetical protein
MNLRNNNRLGLALIILAVITTHFSITAKKKNKPSAATYSCSAVLPDNIYVPSGETVIVNAQVDCLFVTGMGKAFGSTDPVDIAVEKFIPIKFIEDAPVKLIALTTFPTLGNIFAFEYTPIKNTTRSGKIGLKGRPIQVVIRTEPVTQDFIHSLKNELATAQSKGDTESALELTKILDGIETKGMVQIYRRLPSLGQTKFTAIHTKIFQGPAANQIADIRVLPTGNLHIIEHTDDDRKLLVEEPFGEI